MNLFRLRWKQRKSWGSGRRRRRNGEQQRGGERRGDWRERWHVFHTYEIPHVKDMSQKKKTLWLTFLHRTVCSEGRRKTEATQKTTGADEAGPSTLPQNLVTTARTGSMETSHSAETGQLAGAQSVLPISTVIKQFEPTYSSLDITYYKTRRHFLILSFQGCLKHPIWTVQKCSRLSISTWASWS